MSNENYARRMKQIDSLVEALRAYLYANPYLRLGQAIVDLTPARFSGICMCGRLESCWVCTGDSKPDPYDVTDEEWQKILRAALEETEK